jgi:signal peptidase I
LIDAVRSDGQPDYADALAKALAQRDDTAVRTFEIASGAMAPAIAANERVLVRSLDPDEPRRGDVIMFTPTVEQALACGVSNAEAEVFVKRVVGVGGETVEVASGQRNVSVDGQPFAVPGTAPNPDQGPGVNEPRALFRVPKDSVLVLGDNRPDSCDSHVWPNPYVPVSNVTWEVVGVYYPAADARVVR